METSVIISEQNYLSKEIGEELTKRELETHQLLKDLYKEKRGSMGKFFLRHSNR